ncbi:MAG: hypothetical protein V4620_07185 [Bacteroidota bacterium]
MNNKWSFLKDSYWYVPVKYLPALQMSAETTEPTQMIDQTVWQITGYNDGYFWGNCAALIYETGTQPTNNPNAMRIVGTITPEGTVQMAFMPIINIGASMATSGFGKMKEDNKQWVFEMQMSSGVTDLVAHWAEMYETSEGEPSWEKLPGTDYSVPDFLAAAGF